MWKAVPVVVCAASALAWAVAGTYKVGDEVADATLSMADATEAKLSSYADKAVLLFFYGTGDRHAAEDARQIDGVRKARANQKLATIGVARDAKPAAAKKFAEENKIGFAQAADPKAELYGKFATKGLPYVVLIDARRKLKYSASGIDAEAVDAALTEVLGAKDATPVDGGKK